MSERRQTDLGYRYLSEPAARLFLRVQELGLRDFSITDALGEIVRIQIDKRREISEIMFALRCGISQEQIEAEYEQLILERITPAMVELETEPGRSTLAAIEAEIRRKVDELGGVDRAA